MTWPTCTQCRTPFIPINGISGCPWCAPDHRYYPPGEDWRTRYNRRRREARADLRETMNR